MPDPRIMKITSADRCPRCGSLEISRSHRRNVGERFFSTLFLPWRCRDCYSRFLRPRWAKLERKPVQSAAAIASKAAGGR